MACASTGMLGASRILRIFCISDLLLFGAPGDEASTGDMGPSPEVRPALPGRLIGAGGGIGQPLSLLLKADPLVTSLSLYDIRGAPGVAADVSHIDTSSEVTSAVD